MLKGKTALISGGSRGIGRAIALRLAEQGADLALIFSSSSGPAAQVCAEARSLGVRAEAYQGDVADYGAMKTLVKTVKDDFGRIDILVNNAGITQDRLLPLMNETQFDEVLAVDLKGAFNLIRHVAPIFLRNPGGKIINISSVAGLLGNAGQCNYAAAKAGLIGLTKSVARELAGRDVCCNAIAPGFIATDMTAAVAADDPLLANVPLRRMGRPEEVAALAAFLAGPGGDYITGEVIRIDGGLAM